MVGERGLGGVLLVGHGVSGEEGEAVGEQLAWIGKALAERLGVRVEVGFLRQSPKLEEAFGRLVGEGLWGGGGLVVLPMMMAEGFLVGEVRRRVEAESQLRQLDLGEHLQWARALGVHEGMGGVLDGVLERMVEGGLVGEVTAREVTVVVVGHGTERAKSGSGGSVWAQVERLRALGRWGGVEGRFLEQTPRLDALEIERLPGQVVLVVPYMAADGPHTTQDIPAALGLAAGMRSGFLGGKWVVCGGALGVAQGVVGVAEACVGGALGG